jgi:hypothetical protein
MTWAFLGDAQLKAITEIVKTGNSDRILAVVGGAILDDTLRQTIAQRLMDDKDRVDKLFNVGRALGNMEPKIDLLYLLGGLAKPVRNCLYGIVTIRNHFAHHLDATFESDDSKMKGAWGQLALHQDRQFYPHHLFDQDSENEIEKIETKRDIFTVNLKMCLIWLMRDRVSHKDWSSQPLSESELREQLASEKT